MAMPPMAPPMQLPPPPPMPIPPPPPSGGPPAMAMNNGGWALRRCSRWVMLCDVRLQGLSKAPSRQASISSEPGNDAMRDPRLRADSFLAGLASGFGGSTSVRAAPTTAANILATRTPILR